MTTEELKKFTDQLAESTKVALTAMRKEGDDFLQKSEMCGGLGQLGSSPFQRFYEESKILRLFRSSKQFRDEIRDILEKYESKPATNPTTTPEPNSGAK